MSNAHPVSTPLHKTIKLNSSLDSTGPTIEVPYAKAIGSLMYAALSTRPDLAFAIQHLSQFITTYGAEHWTAIKHVLRYLKGSRDSGITFTRDAGLDLEIFVDSDYTNTMDALSINGYVAILGGGAIAWSSKKQRMIALSTTEAKYMALNEGADEHGCRSQHISNSNSASIKHLSLLPSPTASSQPTLPHSIHHLSSIIHHQWQLPILSLLNHRLDFPDIQ